MNKKQLLNIKVKADVTIRDYLKNLMLKLWGKKEDFNPKCPFGVSDWEYDLYQPLIENDIIDGKINDYGYIEDVDVKAGNRVIEALIYVVFEGK